MGWVVAIVWIFVVLAVLVVLGFCGYELRWKQARLSRDAEHLQARIAELQAVQARILELQGRIPSRQSG